MSKAFTIQLISDFNTANFAVFLKKRFPGALVQIHDFGKPNEYLLEKSSQSADLTICWVSENYVLEKGFPYENIESPRTVILLPTPLFNEFSSAENTLKKQKIFSLKSHLAEISQQRKNYFVIDLAPAFYAAPQEVFSPSLWYLSKTPYQKNIFREAAIAVKSLYNGLTGYACKMVIVDLDNTLWGGIVGDDGWQQLRIGGHDPVGEAFYDIQQFLKSLKEKGILLGIVSKNTESIALEAIRNHPEMLLKENDFAGWKINWNDKAENIAALIKEINIGADTVVFLDDNPVERERIRTAFPQVTVPDLPEDPMLVPSALRNLSCFTTFRITGEDLRRSDMYREEKLRETESLKFSSAEAYYASLQIVLTIEPLTKENLPRATQLLNKTNQLNLRTRRMDETELWNWSQQPGNYFYTVRVKDKFGDSGLSGLYSFSIHDNQTTVEDYVLSCRVMGRKIEDAIIQHIVQAAGKKGAKTIVAEFIPTEKNGPCRQVWERSDFENHFPVFRRDLLTSPEGIGYIKVRNEHG